jgi:hypothetical protein
LDFLAIFPLEGIHTVRWRGIKEKSNGSENGLISGFWGDWLALTVKNMRGVLFSKRKYPVADFSPFTF